MKPDANLSTLITAQKGNTTDVLVVKNAPIEVIRYTDSVKVKMYTAVKDTKILGKQFDSIVVDCTNDPTPVIAGGVTSLGYHLIRVANSNVKVVDLDPFTFVGPQDGFVTQMLRPQRTLGSDLNEQA